MNPEYQEKIATIIADVFKTMAFMFAEPIDRLKAVETTRNLHGWIKTWMEFRGPYNGSLMMFFPVELCNLIAANVLGLDNSDERVSARSSDAAGEILNVVCGQICTELAGEKPVFDLTVPQKVAVEAAEAASFCFGDDDALVFSVESKPVVVKLDVREIKA
jgi:CheY-specific phosphatase CheX